MQAFPRKGGEIEMKKLLKLMLVGVFMATVGMTLMGCPDEPAVIEDDLSTPGDMAVAKDLKPGN